MDKRWPKFPEGSKAYSFGGLYGPRPDERRDKEDLWVEDDPDDIKIIKDARIRHFKSGEQGNIEICQEVSRLMSRLYHSVRGEVPTNRERDAYVAAAAIAIHLWEAEEREEPKQ